jgi:hypothetical protein
MSDFKYDKIRDVYRDENPHSSTYGQEAVKTSWYTHQTPDNVEHVTRDSIGSDYVDSIENKD